METTWKPTVAGVPDFVAPVLAGVPFGIAAVIATFLTEREFARAS